MPLAPALLIAAAIAAASLVIWFELRRQTAQSKTGRTLDLLEGFAKIDRLADAGHSMVQIERTADEESRTEIIENNEIALLALLNHYDFLATGYFEDALDRALVMRQKSTAMARAFLHLYPLIERRRWINRTAFADLEMFVENEISAHQASRAREAAPGAAPQAAKTADPAPGRPPSRPGNRPGDRPGNRIDAITDSREQALSSSAQ